MVFTAAPHHDVLVLLVRIALLLFAARAFGEIARRLNQPSVVGEILAGIVLGPSLLGGAVPLIDQWVIPDPGVEGYLLEVVSMMGAMFLLLITGLETDLGLIRRHGRAAIGISIGGIVVPFATGFLLGQMLPVSLLAGADQRLIFALFLATAMSISAIPVIAKVLMDMDLMRRDVGQTIIAAGMTDDAIGWMMLSIVLGLASGAGITLLGVGVAIFKVIAFLAVSFTVGRWLVKRALDYVQDRVGSPFAMLSLVVILAFAWGAIAQGLGLEAVFGAFVVGILLGQMPRLPESVHHHLGGIAMGVFTPIFFAVAGLKVDARALLDPTLALIALIVILVATFGKVVGGYVGGRWIGGRDHWTALAFGVGMNARGAMEIIIATIGLNMGILTPAMFSIIVVMAMVTSLMAPPALRWTLSHVEPEQQELDRLRREELSRGSRVARIHRVLLPVRRRPSGDVVHTLEAAILDRLAAKGSVAVTMFNVAEHGTRSESADFLDRISPLYGALELTRRIVESDEPDNVILAEAQKGYDLLMLGATEHKRTDALDAIFHPVVDRLVRFAPCPSIVLKGGAPSRDWEPRKILVPTNGSQPAREAAELAFRIAAPGELVVVLNVVRITPDDGYRTDAAEERQFTAATHIVSELRDMGEAHGVQTLPLVRAGHEPDQTILEVAREMDAGLIVLGTDLRPGSERLFLGPRVESMLDNATCPVLVYNATPAPTLAP